MSLGDVIVAVLIVGIVGAAVYKIVRDRKNNIKCCGCSESSCCSNKQAENEIIR